MQAPRQALPDRDPRRRHYLAAARAYVAGRSGKRKGEGSGQGHGRRRNPKGSDGQVTKRRTCQSEGPFARN
eukprot:13352436-Alexandrium_andersonii.AAC.1